MSKFISIKGRDEAINLDFIKSLKKTINSSEAKAGISFIDSMGEVTEILFPSEGSRDYTFGEILKHGDILIINSEYDREAASQQNMNKIKNAFR
jgi:hypothetical protein